jgi:hypothetical protein
MACPQVADGGDSFQIWRVATKILKNQSRTTDKGWSSSLGFGRGLTTPNKKNVHVTKCHERTDSWNNWLRMATSGGLL